MISCPNKKLKVWKDLVKNIGENKAYVLWSEYDGNIPDDYYKELPENVVKTGLKATDILMSEKAIQVFNKGKKAGWDLNKILIELQIPKDQKQLLLDLNIIDREQLSLELAANYSYSVEVNTIKTKELQDWAEPDENGNMIYKESKNQKPTSHYSNLTVPGGTNYTENEISTPLITPSIKGHAQFATDNGIGWFRSDEALIGGKNKQIIGDYADEYYENLYNRAIDELDYKGTLEEFRKSHDTIGDNNTKTRRILELQSDLFQKGRDKKDLVNGAPVTDLADLDDLREDLEDGKITQEQFNNIKKGKDVKSQSNNQFLQLLNKDSNWVTFFVKSIIQDSQKKGYEKVLFPTGETAAKVEGHETIANELKSFQDNIDILKNSISMDEDVKFNVIPTYVLPNYNDLSNKNIKKGIEYWENKKTEYKDQGLEKLKPIEAFYENKVTNILNKTYGKENVNQITDEYGNTWNEITLEEKRDNSTILLKKVDFNDLIGSKKNELISDDIQETPIIDNKASKLKSNKSMLFGSKSLKDSFNSTEVLQNIINSNLDLSDSILDLIGKAQKLLRNSRTRVKIISQEQFDKMTINSKGEGTAVMAYNYDLGSVIYIPESSLSNFSNVEIISSFLHEVAHELSIKAVLNPETMAEKSFNEFITKAFEQYEYLGKGLNKSDSYGFTNVQEFVAELYSDDKFQEEIKNLDKNFWQKFMIAIRRLIGLPKSLQNDNLIDSLLVIKTVEDFVNDNEIQLNNHKITTSESNKILLKRIEDDSKYSSLQSKLTNIIDKAKTKTQSIQDRTIKSNNKNSTKSKEEHILRNKELLETLDKYEKSQKWKAVIGYAQSFDKTINHVDSLLNTLLETKNIYEDKLDDLIKRYKDYLSAYDLLPEIKELMSQADLKQFELTDEEKDDYKQLKEFLSEASKKHDSIESKFLAISKAQVLQDFSNPMYNTEVETKQRDELIKEYNSLSDKGGLTVDQYISKMLSTRDLADYKADLKAFAEKTLNDPSKDITMISGKLEDPINIKSKTIQIVNQIYAESFDKVKTLVITKVHSMSKIFDKFVAEKGNKKLSELNKNLIEKDGDGQVYLKGKYNIKFKESFIKLLNDIEDSYENSFKKLQVQDINLDSLRKDKKTISLRKSGEHNFIDNDIAVVTVNGINTGIKVQIDQIKTFSNFNSLSDDRKNDFAKVVGNYKDFEDFKNSNDYAKEDSKKSKMYPEIYNFINNSGSIDIISYVKVEEDSKTSTTFKNRNKMYKAWFKENTIKNEKGKTIPHTKFLNKELIGIEKEVLDGYIKINQENDEIEGFDSLITSIMGAEFHKLASISKNDLERTLELDVKGLTKDKWTDLTKIKSDDIGIDSGYEEKNNQGDIIRRVKTAYRGKIDPNEQSLDLETMFRNEYWNGQNFKEKTAIESKLLLITDIAKSKEYYTGKSKIEVKGELSNTYKKLVGMMESNVYDIYSHAGTNWGKADINKITNALNGYAAGLAMTFNLATGSVNIIGGLTDVFIDAVGGDRFNVKTFAKAEAKYTKEMMNGNLLKDMSRSVKTSYFNQLLEMFDVFGGLGQNEQEALRNNIIRKLGSRKTGNFLNESGEHMMHSILTESILDGIKAMDENNNYLDKDGNITTEDKGASLADMLYMDNHGQLQMNSKVAYSGFNLTVKYHKGGKSQVKLLIKAKVFQLFGVYDIKYKNEISKDWWGKSVMMFKSFFMSKAAYRYTGFTTSYKNKTQLTDDDRFYNSAEKEYVEGTYTTLVRFLVDTGIPNLKMLQTMYMNYHNLTEYEKANLKKATLEIMFTMVILPSVGLLLGAAGGDDKDNKLLWFAMYTNRRLTQELAQFRNPIEATRMIQNPIAGIRFIQNGLNFIYDVATPINLVPDKNESVFGYLDENSKGQNKMGNHLSKLVPIIPQIGVDYKQRYGLEFGKQ